MWIIKFFKNYITAPLFPLKCFGCGKSGKAVCDMCLESFVLAVETPYPDVYCHFSYKDHRIKKILQSIKYFRKLYLVEPLVEKISKSKFLSLFLESDESSILIPIPMSTKRTYSRGGNHIENIAKSFSKHLNIPVENKLLSRKKDTVQQVRTNSKKERLSNLRGVFSVNEELSETIKEKRIILVDDISTTGATIKEAMETLVKYGFKKILAITIAH